MRVIILFLALCCMTASVQAQNSLIIEDTRSTNTTPDTYSKNFMLNLKRTDTLGIPGIGPSFVTLMGMRPWTENNSIYSHELAFASNNNIYIRSGKSPSWEAWRRILIEDLNGNVGIGTVAPGYKLDVIGSANVATLSINKNLLLNMPPSGTDKATLNPIWMGLRTGKRLFPDEEFASGTNTIRFYNNAGSGEVVVTRQTGTGLPNASGYYLQFTSTGFTGNNLGGVRQDYAGKLNGIFIHLFRAKLPVGYSFVPTTNSMGTGGQRYWMTNNVGTGKWEDYAFVIQYGNEGTLGTAGYFYVNGPMPETPLTWQLASCTVIDATSLNDQDDFLKNQVAADQNASFRISGNSFIGGNVGIGVTDTKGYKLAVGGNMVAEKITVKLKTAWPDYVFAPEYTLPSLQEVEAHIKKYQHLPGMPTAKEVAVDGIDVAEMNKKLLQKVEELTLYMIEMKKENDRQQQQIERLEHSIKTVCE
jgi:hypothetical protein